MNTTLQTVSQIQHGPSPSVVSFKHQPQPESTGNQITHKNNDTILIDTAITEHSPQEMEMTDTGSSLPPQQESLIVNPPTNEHNITNVFEITSVSSLRTTQPTKSLPEVLDVVLSKSPPSHSRTGIHTIPPSELPCPEEEDPLPECSTPAEGIKTPYPFINRLSLSKSITQPCTEKNTSFTTTHVREQLARPNTLTTIQVHHRIDSQIHKPSPIQDHTSPKTIISNVSRYDSTEIMSFSQSTGEKEKCASTIKGNRGEMMKGSLKGNSPQIQSHSEPSTSIIINKPRKIEQQHTSIQHNPSTNAETTSDSSLLEDDLEQIPFLKPFRHPNTDRKIQDWNLSVTKPILIIGDSNLCRIPQYSHTAIQIDSFPGANFLHIGKILQKLPPHPHTQKVILSVGINNKEQHPHKTAIKQLQFLWRIANTTFPNATIYTPIIHFSDHLPLEIQNNIRIINEYIETHGCPLLELNRLKFHVDPRDNIHWTANTASTILEYWLQQLNW